MDLREVDPVDQRLFGTSAESGASLGRSVSGRWRRSSRSRRRPSWGRWSVVRLARDPNRRPDRCDAAPSHWAPSTMARAQAIDEGSERSPGDALRAAAAGPSMFVRTDPLWTVVHVGTARAPRPGASAPADRS